MGPYFCIIKKNLYVLGQLKLHYFFQFWVNEKHEHISVSSDAILAKMELTFEWTKYTIAVKSYWKHICRNKMYFSSMNYNMKFRIYKTENVYWKDKQRYRLPSYRRTGHSHNGWAGSWPPIPPPPISVAASLCACHWTWAQQTCCLPSHHYKTVIVTNYYISKHSELHE